jgi:murein DD-endopeptidase MepM/ murein hydrolase activator NlpD
MAITLAGATFTIYTLVGYRATAALEADPISSTPLSADSSAGVLSQTTFLLEDIPPLSAGGDGWNGPDDELSEEQRQAIEAQIESNIQLLEAQGQRPTGPAAVSLAWPLKPADQLAAYGYHGISNFVDQNSGFPSQVLDYACGNRSYDTASGYNHPGTDIFIWPFPWNKMDSDLVEVVAAAPGLIVYKQDGYDDRSCSANNTPWNAISVQHADGSIAWYGHLKRSSLTSKAVGSTVEAGEYLGVVGSSGNSTGPHLHFELHNAANHLIDPYQGSCNALNPDSWWATQTPYYDSAVNQVTTGHSAPAFPTCPAPESGNIEDSFNQGDVVYFTTYYRDQLSSQASQYAIYRPDGSLYQSWTHNSPETHYAGSWWWWSFQLGPIVPAGTWRFAVLFQGQTYETYFNVGAPIEITVTAPTAGDVVMPGATYNITWNDNIGGNVRLELYRDGVYESLIAASTPSDGGYSWTPPTNTTILSGYQVRIIDLANDQRFGQSGPFTIGDLDGTFPEKVFLPAVLGGE